MSNTGDMLFLFQLMAEEDQVGRGQVTYNICPEAAGDTENDLHQDVIASLATDRYTWRKFVVACSATE